MTNIKRKPIPLKLHLDFGEDCKQFRESMLCSPLLNIYGKSSRPAKSIRRAMKALDSLKNEMDFVVCRDYPNYPDVTQVYYGASRKWISENDAQQSP